MIFNLFKNIKQEGYTLVEILVVIAIIGILSSVTFVAFSSAREKSRVSTAKMFEANHVGVLRNYLVAEWKFDECSGLIAYDSSGNDLNFTLIGNPIWSTDTIDGRGCSIDFNGSSQYGYTPDNDIIDLQDNYTLSLWINLKIDSTRTFIAKSNTTDYRGAYFGYGWSGYGFIFGSNNVSNTPYREKRGDDLNKWHLLTGVVKGGVRKLYIDGNFVSSSSSGTSSWNNPLGLYIGSGVDGVYKTKMIIDNFRIYSSYLTASDIQKLYAEESAQRKLAEAK